MNIKKVFFLLNFCINIFAAHIEQKTNIEAPTYCVSVPLTYICNPIFNPKKSCCSNEKSKFEDLWINVFVYQKGNICNQSYLNLPLRIFLNHDDSFKKTDEEIMYRFDNEVIKLILKDDDKMFDICFKDFIESEKKKKTCVIL